MEEDDVLRRSQIRWDKGRKMMMMMFDDDTNKYSMQVTGKSVEGLTVLRMWMYVYRCGLSLLGTS